jgi:hypothetical protein
MSNIGSCVDTDVDDACSYMLLFTDGEYNLCTVELHLPELTGTASHPYMQNIRINRFFFRVVDVGNLKLGCYYLQYVLASKLLDHAWLEVLEALEAITLYCT